MTVHGQASLDRFRFRDLHPNILVGMASDRYAGWIGQIYSEDPKQAAGSSTQEGYPLCASLTPLRMSYEDSYAKAFPFDKLVERMLNPQMIEDTVSLIRQAIEREKGKLRGKFHEPEARISELPHPKGT